MAFGTQADFVGMGFNPWVAEALEGRELSVIDVQAMTEREVLDEVFSWHGFIGWTSYIIDAVDNVRNVEALS